MSKSKSSTSTLPTIDRSECVKVGIRCRPLNDTEKERGEKSILNMDRKRGTVALMKDSTQPVMADGDNNTGDNKLFTFDLVYPPLTPQIDIYNTAARPIVDSVLNGYNGTIFAYGQTGSGKTFTMEGVQDSEELRGIMPNSFIHIFDAVKDAGSNVEFLVRASFIEIYLDEVYDLLSKTGERVKMELRESKDKGVYVEGLQEFVVKSSADLLKVLKSGTKMRKVGATKMNAGSSRSHSLLMVTVEASEKDAAGEVHYRVGRLNLVDLAGSERQKRTEATGDRLDEAKAINLSLSALGNVIKALINPNAKHIPFRDSKLTRLLQDSLGGNTKTCMLANLSGADLSYDETLSTLRYANRAKNIKNKPKINEDPKDAMLREYQEEIQRLKQQLMNKRVGLGGMVDGGGEGGVTYVDGQSIIEENVIYKEVVRETGITAEHVEKLKEKTRIEEEILKAKSEKEKDKLRKEKDAVEAAVKTYEEELSRKNELLEKEKEEFQKLQQIIKDKESQLIQGEGELDRAAKKREELMKAEEELSRKKEEERRLAKELEEAKEAQVLLVSHSSSKEEEKNAKMGKIKQLLKLYEKRKNELIEQREEWEEEKGELVDNIRDLDRQLKLKQLIVHSFIPDHFVDLIGNNAMWEEMNQEWRIEGQEMAGNNVDRLKGNFNKENHHNGNNSGNKLRYQSRIEQIMGSGETEGGESLSEGALGGQFLSYQTYKQNLQMTGGGSQQGRR